MTTPLPPVASPYPESSQATLILVLGIVGILSSLAGVGCCGLLSPIGSIMGGIAWFLGRKEIAAIESGRRNPSQLGTARGGMITGIVATILGLLMFILVIVLFGFALTSGFVNS